MLECTHEQTLPRSPNCVKWSPLKKKQKKTIYLHWPSSPQRHNFPVTLRLPSPPSAPPHFFSTTYPTCLPAVTQTFTPSLYATDQTHLTFPSYSSNIPWASCLLVNCHAWVTAASLLLTDHWLIMHRSNIWQNSLRIRGLQGILQGILSLKQSEIYIIFFFYASLEGTHNLKIKNTYFSWYLPQSCLPSLKYNGTKWLSVFVMFNAPKKIFFEKLSARISFVVSQDNPQTLACCEQFHVGANVTAQPRRTPLTFIMFTSQAVKSAIFSSSSNYKNNVCTTRNKVWESGFIAQLFYFTNHSWIQQLFPLNAAFSSHVQTHSLSKKLQIKWRFSTLQYALLTSPDEWMRERECCCTEAVL